MIPLKTKCSFGFTLIVVTILVMMANLSCTNQNFAETGQNLGTQYELTDSATNVSALWRQEDIQMRCSRFTSFLAQNDNSLVYSSFKDGWSLVGLNIKSGEVAWEIDRGVYAGFDHDYKNVYLSEGDEVFAYSMNSGDLVWSTKLQSMRNAQYITVDSGSVFVQSSNNVAPMYILDASNGEIEKTMDSMLGFFVRDEIFFYKSFQRYFSPVNLVTDEHVWYVELDDILYRQPTVSEDVIALKSGSGTVGKLYAIDIHSGRVLWSAEDVVSNIAIWEDKAYFLTIDSELKVINLSEGSELEVITFQPKIGELSASQLTNNCFNISAANDQVSLYFSNTEQLFSIQLSVSNN